MTETTSDVGLDAFIELINATSEGLRNHPVTHGIATMVEAGWADDAVREAMVLACGKAIKSAQNSGLKPTDPDWTARVHAGIEVCVFESCETVSRLLAMQFGHAVSQQYLSRRTGDRASDVESAILNSVRAACLIDAGMDPLFCSEVLNQVGISYFARVSGRSGLDVERAIAACEGALRLVPPGRHKKLREYRAIALINLASAYNDDRLPPSEEKFRRAADCCCAALDEITSRGHPDRWAAAMHTLGVAWIKRVGGDRADNIEQAIACYRKALKFHTLEIDAYGWAATTDNLGLAYCDRLVGDQSQNTERAIRCFQDALSVRTRREYLVEWASTTINLANTLLQRLHGRRDKTIDAVVKHCDDVLSVLSEETYPDLWAAAQTALGNALAERFHGDGAAARRRAIDAYDNALRVRTKDRDVVRWARLQMNLGTVYDSPEIGDVDSALRCYQNALAIFEATGDRVLLASVCLNIGLLYADRAEDNEDEKLEQGVEYFGRAISEGTSSLSLDRLIGAYRAQARALMRLGRHRWQDAALALEAGLDAFMRRRMELMTAEARRRTTSALTSVGHLLALLHVEAGEPAEALVAVETCRAIGLREMLASHDILLERMGPKRRAAIRAARERVARLRWEAAGSGERTGSAARPYHVVLDELGEAHRTLVREFSRGQRTLGEPLDLGEILDTIPADRTLIVPVSTEFGGFAFAVPGGTANLTIDHVVRLPGLKTDLVRKRLHEWLTAYFSMHAEGDEAALSHVRRNQASNVLGELLDWLWQDVMGPILTGKIGHHGGGLAQPEKLTIMPTGDFALMPLHAAWRDGRTVMDDYVVSYVPSTFAWRMAKRKQSVSPEGTAGLLALINPTGSLHFAEAIEVGMLRRFFSDAESDRLYVGADATKAVLGEHAPECGYLHVSCHGEYNWEEPDRSGLLLARDEWFTIPEIMSELRLDRCKWAMLAACETGMAEIHVSPEEAYGQVMAFLHAGAPAVTAALWSIADSSTSVFVGKAYEAHLSRGLEPAAAVRAAALALRDLSASDFLKEVHALPSRSKHLSAIRFAEIVEETRSESDAAVTPETRPFESPLYWAAFATWGV